MLERFKDNNGTYSFLQEILIHQSNKFCNECVHVWLIDAFGVGVNVTLFHKTQQCHRWVFTNITNLGTRLFNSSWRLAFLSLLYGIIVCWGVFTYCGSSCRGVVVWYISTTTTALLTRQLLIARCSSVAVILCRLCHRVFCGRCRGTFIGGTLNPTTLIWIFLEHLLHCL